MCNWGRVPVARIVQLGRVSNCTDKLYENY